VWIRELNVVLLSTWMLFFLKSTKAAPSSYCCPQMPMWPNLTNSALLSLFHGTPSLSSLWSSWPTAKLRPVGCAKYISSLFVFLILPASLSSLKQWKAFPSHPAGQNELTAEWEPGLWWSTASWGFRDLSYQLYSNRMEYHRSDRRKTLINFLFTWLPNQTKMNA